ncbi:MAG: acetate--CoA ligase [Actinobacteria bacterium]|nr:acetate--CoA ligase [Actinomycetota bacterium]
MANTYPPIPEYQKHSRITDMAEFDAMWKRSVEDPDGFWGEMADKLVTWTKKWDKVSEWDFHVPYHRWFQGAKLNVCWNVLDKHVEAGWGDKTAIIFEGDQGDVREWTYKELLDEVTRFANVLKKHGVKKGDRVAIYLPMIGELPIAMLACARIGAIHMVVFGGFSAEALKARIDNCGAKLLITVDKGWRGGKHTAGKVNADAALQGETTVEKVIVVKRIDGDVNMVPGRDVWFHEEIAAADVQDGCECAEVDAEDPLFILYTSGSTGTPKGCIHTNGGYLTYVAATMKYIVDYQDGDVWFCSADIGWVTGHSYAVYGPLWSGITSVIFEGLPTYPEADRYWAVCEKHKVTRFYTAPTVIRMLAGQGTELTDRHAMNDLKWIGSVGEPIDATAWEWYYNNVGKGRCPLCDTWWQTENGGHCISPLPGATILKPGSAGRPFFGIKTVVLNEKGEECAVGEDGALCMTQPWPGFMKGMWADPDGERFKEVYFGMYPGKFFTGDGCMIDADGDHWLRGRIDDVVNVSGHRLGTAEIEAALITHPAVAEAAVVGFPHPVKGTGLYTYVTLTEGYEGNDDLRKTLAGHVRKIVGPIATPDKMQFTPALPKTRSGKVMRRILRKIAEGRGNELGDVSTLADPSVVDELKANALV